MTTLQSGHVGKKTQTSETIENGEKEKNSQTIKTV